MDNSGVFAVYVESENCMQRAERLAAHLGVGVVTEKPEKLHLRLDENGLFLADCELEMQADFTQSLKRFKPNNLNGEMIVKASRIKNKENPVAIDATAGLGEDSILLAAAGFKVVLCEYNPVICALLCDALERAKGIEELASVVDRMKVFEGDSIQYLKSIDYVPDVVVLDPMFPERQKSGLIKKKFQLLQQLESPCSDENELMSAALEASPHKIVIKRPLKGPFLAGVKPHFSLNGKAIRYDCIVKA